MRPSSCSPSSWTEQIARTDYDNQDTASEYSDDFELTAESSPQKRWNSPGIHVSGANSRKSFFDEERESTSWRITEANLRRQPENKKFLAKTVDQNKMVSQILQATQRKVDEAEDELCNIRQRFEAMRKENRILMTLQQKQEIVIRRFDDKNNDLPRMITQHAEEQKTLKFHLKKARTAKRSLELKLRDNNKILMKKDWALDSLKKIVSNKELRERSRLARELVEKERDLELAERKINKLDKHMELSAWSFLRQINTEKRKHKDTLKKLDEVEKERAVTKTKLKEKERALDNSNIYELRKKISPRIRRRSVSNAHVQESKSKALGFLSKPMISDESSCNIPQKSLNYWRPEDTIAVDNSPEEVAFFSEEIPARNGSRCSRENAIHVDATNSKVLKNVSPAIHVEKNNLQCEPSPSRASPVLSQKNDEFSQIKLEGQRTPIKENFPKVFLTSKFDISDESGDSLNKCNSSSIPSDVSVKNSPTANTPVSEKNLSYVHMKKVLKDNNNIRKESEVARKRMEDVVSAGAQYHHVMQSREENGRDAEDEKMPLWREPEIYEVEKKTKKSYQFSKEIENLHLGIPTALEKCKKKLEKLENEVLYLGNYSPTVGGTPTRRKYLPVGEYKSNTGTEKAKRQKAGESNEDQLKEAKECDLIMRLFGKLETEKDKLLRDDSSVGETNLSSDDWLWTDPKNEQKVSTRTSSNESVRKTDRNAAKLHGDGDNLDIRLKPLSERENLALQDDNIDC